MNLVASLRRNPELANFLTLVRSCAARYLQARKCRRQATRGRSCWSTDYDPGSFSVIVSVIAMFQEP